MNILFITNPYPNYVPDLLLHGLRKLLGAQVVDYPRKQCLYEGILGLGVCPDDMRCPGWFPDDDQQIDRSDIRSKVQRNFFDMVICDFRAAAEIHTYLKEWPKQCIIVDGEDAPQSILPGPYAIYRRETDGSDYSIPLPMAMPEEIFKWITHYDDLPKCFSIGFLGSTQNDGRKSLIDTLSIHYPDALFKASEIPTSDNPAPTGRMSRDTYYQKLQQCRVVLSLAGAGFDTFRFWEHAACNAIHIAQRLPLFIPNDFKESEEILRFDNIDHLRRVIDDALKDHQCSQSRIAQGRHKLIQQHLTTHRAAYFIDRTNKVFGK